MWPPAALGQRKSALEDKVAAWVQSLWLDAGDPGLLRVFDHVLSITPDFGTEAKVPDIMDMDVRSLLPRWTMSTGDLQADGVAADGPADDDLQADDGFRHPEQPPNEYDQAYVLKRTLLVPGMNHIIANMEAQVDHSMPYWDTFIPQMQAVIRWASVQDNLNRFIEQCLRDTKYWHFRFNFETPLPKLAEWRWGTMGAVMRKLRPMLHVLGKTWDARLYTHANLYYREGYTFVVSVFVPGRGFVQGGAPLGRIGFSAAVYVPRG